ncbi:MAG: hypothetical protein MJZ68_06915 [archaeon]|nr:hypothetical protein [archaeon]
MAQINIVYSHSKEPEAPAGGEIRRKSIAEMEKYMEQLVLEMMLAEVSTGFKSVEGEGRNEVFINGKRTSELLEGLEIRKPELDEDTPIVAFERSPDDWHKDIIEDIPDLLMKNALSKEFSNTEKLKVKELIVN